jgi:hypothetical protein
MRGVAHDAYLFRLALFSFLITLAVYGAFLYCRRLYFRHYPAPAKVVRRTDMSAKVDLAILFKAGSSSLSKATIRDEAQQAEEQYTRLVSALKGAGLHAAGRRGESNQVIVLVWCPSDVLTSLVQKERWV